MKTQNENTKTEAPIKMALLLALAMTVAPQAFARSDLGGTDRNDKAKQDDYRSPNRKFNTKAYKCALDKAKEFLKKNRRPAGLDDQKVVLVDLGAPPDVQRMSIVDLKEGTVVRHTVSNGKTDKNGPKGINTNPGSNGSELGFMKFGEKYLSEKFDGWARRLVGLEADNRDVERRAIVLHPATYVTEGGWAGRSEGCFAVSPKVSLGIVNGVTEGTLLYSYDGNKACN